MTRALAPDDLYKLRIATDPTESGTRSMPHRDAAQRNAPAPTRLMCPEAAARDPLVIRP